MFSKLGLPRFPPRVWNRWKGFLHEGLQTLPTALSSEQCRGENRIFSDAPKLWMLRWHWDTRDVRLIAISSARRHHGYASASACLRFTVNDPLYRSDFCQARRETPRSQIRFAEGLGRRMPRGEKCNSACRMPTRPIERTSCCSVLRHPPAAGQTAALPP